MDTTAPADAPATAWARTRRRGLGFPWETLEAHLFAAHPDIQLLLRVRGRVLPYRGAWYLAAFAAATAAGLTAFGLGPSRPAAALAAAGVLLLVAAACEVTGFVRAWRGYGTTADNVWGWIVAFTAFAPVVGVAMIDTGTAAGESAAPVVWLAIAVAGLGFTGISAPTTAPHRRSARLRRAVEAVAALPEAERERIRADLAAALDVLVESKVMHSDVAREALEAPLGALASTRYSESPG
ncbi:hypothetical protein LO763_02045 [Glycomyces sp. A-F 0318]|uniref:hypothetical protein n=1 Tax=Glycomyces amatae TaxID=2881355 RepID=UPI001E5F74AF|nr:hypothetical protein [Glycomyces amatae]MCD0442405.1 hypothetical protein [Glycomyces amatae]